MQIYERIRGLREDRELSQQNVADFLKMKQPQYSRYESGQRQFPIDVITTLCLYFQVSADYILGLPEGLPYGKSLTRPKGKKQL